MKIAMLTVTRNDDYRFEEWCQYYSEYKNDINLHIIIDDASDLSYLKKIRSFFTESVIIARNENGGSNAALNDGIRYALKDSDIDALLILDNDIKLKPGSIKALYDYLYSDSKLGMVGPLVFQRESDRIENFGVHQTWFSSKHLYHNRKIDDLPDCETMYVDLVPGGINMVKRSFYETVGLQDEEIFMYCDERDMCYRTYNAGLREGVTKNAVAWHQHKYCPPIGKRLKSTFLTARNRTYLVRKYCGVIPAFISMSWSLIIAYLATIKNWNNSESKEKFKQISDGVMAGFSKKLDNSNIWY